MVAAAGLMAKGAKLLEVIPTDRPGHFGFCLMVEHERQEEFRALYAKCESEMYDFMVELGVYERCHRQVRVALQKRKETDDNDRRRQ